jgi:hypothetical protein
MTCKGICASAAGRTNYTPLFSMSSNLGFSHEENDRDKRVEGNLKLIRYMPYKNDKKTFIFSLARPQQKYILVCGLRRRCPCIVDGKLCSSTFVNKHRLTTKNHVVGHFIAAGSSLGEFYYEKWIRESKTVCKCINLYQ